jgi:hypothetical protein
MEKLDADPSAAVNPSEGSTLKALRLKGNGSSVILKFMFMFRERCVIALPVTHIRP